MGDFARYNDDPMSADSGPLPQETPSLVGQTIDGRYRLTRKLGEGGMGEVYAAEHVHIDKRYAVKLLRPEIVSNAEAVARFRQEAKSSSSIGHRNIIAIEDFGSLSDGRVYMCMELLNGAPLNDMITQPMPVDRLLNILIQTGHGLAAAHAKGIIHRDMKPENIYVTVGPNGEDVPKLLDFGIAKVAGNDGQNHLTRTGTIFGTPFYMAPEQALGNPVDARTDIYAVGVIMYEVFAGSLPFQGESFMGILTQHITTEPEPVAQRAAKAGRTLPPGLADIVMRCMRKNPAERFSSMDELVAQLVQIYRGFAGAGMSTYMEAFPVAPTTGHQIQVTPPPMTGVNAAQSQPFLPQHHPTGPNPLVSTPSGGVGLYDPNAPIVDVAKKKSNTGLIVAIILLLAAGGGVAAFLIMNNKDDGKGKGSGTASGSQVAIIDDHTKGSDKVPDKGSDGAPKIVDTTKGSAEIKPGSDTTPKAGSDTTPKAGSDEPKAGSDATVVKAGSDAVVPPPPAKATKVFLKGLNVLNFDTFDEAGKKLDEPVIEVEAGKTRTLTVKSKGFKDKQIVVDDKKDFFSFKLDPKPGTVVVIPKTGSNTTPPHNGSNDRPHGLDHLTPDHSVPPPDHTNPPSGGMDCSKRMVDPHNKACYGQYCRVHPGIDGCPE